MKKNVHYIPEGYHSITPYLIVNGAKKAISFYKNVFGAKEVMCMEKPDGKVGHAELTIGNSKIMLADEHPEVGANAPHAGKGTPIGISLYIENVDDVIAKAVAAGAKIIRPIETMFYGDRIGGLEDPFGHTWYVATHVEDVSMEELQRRAAAAHQ